MNMPKEVVRSPGGLNLVAFAETWGKIMGERYGADVTLTSITKEETGEVLYKRDRSQDETA